MTDDEILEAVDRRFAAVETRLPPTRVIGADRRVRGTTITGWGLRGASAPLIAVFVVVALGVGVLATSTSRPGAPADAVAAASPSPAPVASSTPEESPDATPDPSAEPLLILRGGSGGDTLLIEHFRWGPCLVERHGLIVTPDGAAIDRVIDETGVVEGWVEVPIRFTKVPTTARYWVSPSPESAARGYRAGVLAIGGRGSTWIEVGGKGHELVAFHTPKGRTFWLLIGGVADSPC
jgi:hypothetical protein